MAKRRGKVEKKGEPGKRHLYNIHSLTQAGLSLSCPNCNRRHPEQMVAVGMCIPCTCGHQMDLVFYSCIHDPDELKDWLAKAVAESGCRGISYDFESTGNFTNDNDPWTCDLVGCSFGRWDQPGVAVYVPLNHITGENMDMQRFIDVAAPVIATAPMGVHGASIMEWPWTYVKLGVEPNILCDTAVVAFLDDPNRKHRFDARNISLKGMAKEIWDIHVTEITDLVDLNNQHFGILPVKQAYEYGCQDSDLTTRLVHWGMDRVMADQPTIWRLESRIISISARMTLRGIKLDPQVLADGSVLLDEEIEQLEEDAFRDLGYDIVKNSAGEWMRPFDLGSPAKVSVRLFDEMGLPPPGKRGKSGYYSTASENLKDLRDEYEVVDKILLLREAKHMRNNFVAALPEYINPVTGYVHGKFNQTGAPTGRFSHSSPNTAQVPKLRD